MSERILKALMQLFAIIAEVDVHADTYNKDNRERQLVELFLKQELSPEQVSEYLGLYDDFVISHHFSATKKDGNRKRTSVNSVKLLRICTQINSELTQKQRIIVLLRIFEFIRVNNSTSNQELEFASTVADTFNISKEELVSISSFTQNKIELINKEDPNLLVIDGIKTVDQDNTRKHVYSEGFVGQIWVLCIPSVNFYFFKYFGKSELLLNGQIITNDRHHILNQGSSIRSARITPIYYSDIISKFLSGTTENRIVFKAEKIEYRFSEKQYGLHDFSFSEESGRIIGIMGGSGAGKSTLLNILNGNLAPTSGVVTINNIDIHKQPDLIEGVIGYISQDDLLIDELTVFQNLFFNAKLCFSNLSESVITRKVISVLQSLGLYESKDLKVGNPLEKFISGGQRKRLNIALELIREPSVLFVDEPTSGLSSRDSENIMDLLKELALKGKLVFVVIHQPSSDIFKMFDKLIILDQGGYQIYSGNPVDAVIYFKECTNHANSQESECRTCGNVNPEQIFNIIETKVVDEYGNQTSIRKTPPTSWNRLYKKHSRLNEVPSEEDLVPPKSSFSIPNKFKQFGVFFQRDVLSKLTNRQYVLINLFEAPLLAAILAFFIKFFTHDNTSISEYVFQDNENIPQYLFIAVIVALFIGLSIAAEEIIKDRKILRRESFLNLSRGTYLSSKVIILFIISAIQSFLFVIVGNTILEIHSLTFEYWIILFSISCTANVLGLNISASFDSAKVIYILIPILIIPQLLFSGVIVKFDKLNPAFSNEESVPWIGNIMASRWAYEALAVVQFRDNPFEQLFFEDNIKKSENGWKRDYWVPQIQASFDLLVSLPNTPKNKKEIDNNFMLLQNEFIPEFDNWANFDCKECREIVAKKDKKGFVMQRDLFDKSLEIMRGQYNAEYADAAAEMDLTVTKLGKIKYRTLKSEYFNQSLGDQVTNRNGFDKILEINNHLVQKDDPIFLIDKKPLFDAHFFAPKKYIFGKFYDTFIVNICVLWLMTLLFCVTLYFDAFRKMMNIIGLVFSRLKRKRA